jgi:diadenosine tetraphosphatase ApaH/serine/threonine PP2A family protein phosphatase
MSLIYAVGDIHGSLSKLHQLIARCEQHAAGRPMTFVFLGDYVDRGPDSAGVIRTVIELQSKLRERVIALKGNHEAIALGVIDGTLPADYWLAQGGTATLRSYGVQDARDLPRDHVEWLRSLRLSYDDGRRFFVHAGIDPNKPLDAQDERDLLWIREPFLFDRRDYGRLIVHGHTPLPTDAPDLRSNRLNLDTGAVFGGVLTAAVFDGPKTSPTAFLQAG